MNFATFYMTLFLTKQLQATASTNIAIQNNNNNNNNNNDDNNNNNNNNNSNNNNNNT